MIVFKTHSEIRLSPCGTYNGWQLYQKIDFGDERTVRGPKGLLKETPFGRSDDSSAYNGRMSLNSCDNIQWNGEVVCSDLLAVDTEWNPPAYRLIPRNRILLALEGVEHIKPELNNSAYYYDLHVGRIRRADYSVWYQVNTSIGATPIPGKSRLPYTQVTGAIFSDTEYLVAPYTASLPSSTTVEEAVEWLAKNLIEQGLRHHTFATYVYTNKLFSVFDATLPYLTEAFGAQNLASFAEQIPSPRVSWGDLAAEAYSTVPFFTGNGVAYLTESLALGKQALDTASTLMGVGADPRLIADLYLAFHYGWNLTAKDTLELADAIDRYTQINGDWQIAAATRREVQSQWTHDCRYTSYFSLFGEESSILKQFLYLNDLYLDAANAWDMVPFSFVVDWFVPVGENIEKLENYNSFRQFHTHQVSCKTHKSIRHGPPSIAGVNLPGRVSLTRYYRQYLTEPIKPVYTDLSVTPDFDHWLESTALVVANTRH